MLNPTLHITLSSLHKILQGLSVMFPRELAEEIFDASGPYAIRDRFIVEKKGSTKAKRVKKAQAFTIPDEEVEVFNGLLTSYRKAEGHRFIPIRREDAMWKQLAEVAHDAKEFCSTMGYVDTNTGYLRYIKKGVELMRGKYGLNKFKYYRDRIVDEIGLERILADDPTPETTKLFTDTYVKLLLKESGVTQDPHAFTVTQRVDLYYGATACTEMRVTPASYLKAQFAELNFMGGVPETTHLHGDQAKQRVRSYLNKQGVEAKDVGRSGSMKQYYQDIREANENKK